MNIQDAVDVIESVSGFTDESTPVGEAWLEVLSFISCAPPDPVAPTRKEAVDLYSEVMAAHDCQTLGQMAEHFARAVLAKWGHQ